MCGYKIKQGAKTTLSISYPTLEEAITKVTVDLEVSVEEIQLDLSRDEVLQRRLNLMVKDIMSALKAHKEDIEYQLELRRAVIAWCEKVLEKYAFKRELIMVKDHVDGCVKGKIPVDCKSCIKFCYHCSKSCDCYKNLGTCKVYLKPTKRCNFKTIKMWD